ncbi:MAG: penicillin acylase family protein, partial [Blastocatellia bacterium]
DGRPEHWTAVDCAAIAILMAQRFGSMGGSEAEKARVLKFLREKFGDDGYRVFDDLFWRNDPKAPVTIPETDTSVGAAGVLETGSQVASRTNERQRRMIAAANDESLIQASDVAEERGIISYAASAGLPTRWGSYALAVSGGKSISGNAILLAGPQMGFTTPSIAYEIHYSAPNLNVVGMTIPGIPQILIGHNNFLAWTATSGFVDEVDIFAEKLNPQNKYQYMFQGRYIGMNRRSESISVKGEAQPRQVEVYRTVHGPVVSWDEANGIAYSRAASYAGNELCDMTAARGFGLSRNTTEFAGYAAGIYTSRNYLVATIRGDIGFWSCGKPPIRDKSIDPRLPVPGAGAYEWKGLRPFSQMPQAVNPKQGYLFNWNNKPERDWDSEGDAVWGEVEYCTRIDQLVKQHDKLTVDDVRDIAQDISTFDIVAYWLKPYLLSAIRNSETKTRDERLRQAADYMRAWDNHIRDDSVGTTITRLAIVKVREAIFGDELGDLNKAFPRFGQDTPLQHFVQMSVVLRALEGKNAGLALYHDYFHGRQKDAVLVKAINDSLDLSTSVVGQQMNLWKWQQCEIRFGLTGNIPNSNRGTYIEMVELSQPLIRAESVLAPGESEDSRSRHFADQREMAGYWRFKDLIYQAEQFDRPSLHSIECQ